MSSYVTIDVQIDDVLPEISDKQLIAELESRRSMRGPVQGALELNLIQDAYSALMRGDTEYCALILNRVLYPKWATPEDALKAYVKATEGEVH